MTNILYIEDYTETPTDLSEIVRRIDSEVTAENVIALEKSIDDEGPEAA